MLRGHFKSFAIHSLITVLVASPLVAAGPGSAARRASNQGKRSTQTRSAKDTHGQAGNVHNGSNGQTGGQQSSRQVSGKQPSTANSSTNRKLTLLPNFLRNSESQASATKKANNIHRAQAGGQNRGQRTSQATVQTGGILDSLFGEKKAAPKPATRTAGSPRPSVDWEGIPYHQARSKTSTQNPAPIRDPRPGETRIAGPSRLTPQSKTPTLASPDVPKPPALAPIASSRRSTPARVVSNRMPRSGSSVLSPLSSSRRSGRREVPALHASEVAAAADPKISDNDLAPKVARRALAAKTEPSTKTADPSEIKTPDSAEAVKAKPTPAADVAIKPQSSPTPAAAETATPNSSQPPAATESIAAVPAGEGSAIPASRPLETESPSKTPLSAEAAPQATDALNVPQIASAPSNVGSQQQPPSGLTQPSPSAAQFVGPNLPPPAVPRFGPNGSVVGHRSGPPASAFQSRVASRRPLNPSNVPLVPATAPIGSGVVQNLPAPAPEQPPVGQLQRPASPQYGSPYPNSDPYAAQDPYVNPTPYAVSPGQTPAETYQRDPYAAAPPAAHHIAQQPTGTAAPSQIHPSHTQPSNTQPSVAGPYGAVPPSSHTQPTPQAPPQRVPYGASSGSPSIAAAPGSSLGSPRASTPNNARSDRSGRSSLSHTPFQTPPKPRAVASRPTTSELAQGQTAVASELPGIRVVTHGPSSVIIRQAHEFEIRVENRGAIDAEGVMIRAIVPDWADVKGQTTSRGNVENQQVDESDRLVWTLDSLPAGTTEKLFVRLQALESGVHELDVDWTLIPQKSVAKVEVREPKLDLVIEGPEQIIYGESQSYKVRVLNPGDGDAANVVFTLSPNSSTPQTQRIGNIPRGKEAQFEIELTAQDLGDLKIHGLAAGDLGLKAQAQKSIRVSAAELEAVLAGPEMQYQNTTAMYHLQITNQGSATCKNINATLALPPGIRYQGGIDIARKQGTKLTWPIESLPPGATREYEFNCTMVSPGKQTFDFAASGSAAGEASVVLDTQVESIADLVMTIQDPAAPAPVGSEVTYEILIRNRGSRQADGVRAIAQFSNGIEPRRIEGHSGQVLTGQVLFDPIEKILPGEEFRIRVIAEADGEGHHRFRTEIRSGETVLVAEEATQYLSKRGQRVSRRSTSTAR